MTSNNVDFVARCMIGHDTKDIRSLISEVENIQNDMGGVKIVQVTQEDFDALTDKDPSTIYLVSNGDKTTLYIGGAEVNEIEGIKVNNTTINPDANKVVNITVPTTAADVSALPDTTKYAAVLSLTIDSSTFVVTGQLKDQNGDNLGTAQTIDLPLESVVVGGSYNSQTKKVVLTLQNGNTIEFSVADLVSGLQTELSASNKLNPAYIDYDSTHRAVSDVDKSTWNSKQNALSSTQLDAVNSGIDSAKVEQIETNKNNILSITPTITTVDHTATQTTDYEQVTGLTYTLSAGKTAIFNVSAINQRGAIRGIKIATETTLLDTNTVAISETSANYRALTCGGIYTNTGSSDVTLYVFVKFYSPVKNAVTLSAYQV